jgi:uncharacterized protein (TIGR03435 family)
VGDRAPEIHFDKLLPEQPVASARFEALTGKVIVLEMWATWCGPCVRAIPHLNELAEKFRDRPVVFLSVTDEEQPVVEAFLKNRPISGWVGIAHTQSPLSSYGVDGIPTTFLIDATGKIGWVTEPEKLSASMLEDLIAGRPPMSPLIELTIQPWQSRNVYDTFGLNNLFLQGTTLRRTISSLWDVQVSRTTGRPLEDNGVYDVSLSIPGIPRTNFRSRAREVIASAFHVKVERETRDMEVWILAKTDAKPASLQPGGTISDRTNEGQRPATLPSVGGSYKLINCEVSLLARILEVVVKKPVVDETGITGRYDFQVSYDKADPEGSIEAMRKAGFRVEPGHRMIEFLVVTKAE